MGQGSFRIGMYANAKRLQRGQRFSSDRIASHLPFPRIFEGQLRRQTEADDQRYGQGARPQSAFLPATIGKRGEWWFLEAASSDGERTYADRPVHFM